MDYTLTFSTTAAQEIALAHVLARVNADQRANGREPFASSDAFALSLVQEALDRFVQQYQQAIRETFGTALDQATPDQIAKAADVLGVKVA